MVFEAMDERCAIDARDVTKAYRLYRKHSDRVRETFHPFRKKYHYPFFALDHVSLRVARGETVGIIGRNGSGKSTLLQIICGVLQPSGGEVTVNGRISAILELGAGFNPEFTGRQNVYLCGRILGLSREEIEGRFGLIAAFADVGDFIDQPVKAYSSGMAVRLAFAIASHVDADVMVVDEALAVGDAAFQRKCFGRMQAIRKQGKTILFVSHEAGTVVELCDRAVLLDQGELLLDGNPKDVVSRYYKLLFAPKERAQALREAYKTESAGWGGGGPRAACGQADEGGRTAEPEAVEPPDYFDPGLVPKSTVFYESRGAAIRDAAVTDRNGRRVNVLVRGREYLYRYTLIFDRDAFRVRWGAMIKTVVGTEIAGLKSHPDGHGIDFVDQGKIIKAQFCFRCALMPGVYFWNSGVTGYLEGEEMFLHRVVDIAMFRVQAEPPVLGAGVLDLSIDGRWDWVVEDG